MLNVIKTLNMLNYLLFPKYKLASDSGKPQVCGSWSKIRDLNLTTDFDFKLYYYFIYYQRIQNSHAYGSTSSDNNFTNLEV